MTKQQKIQKYFNQKNKLTLKNKKYWQQVKFFTGFMLREDLDSKGDITTDLLIKNNSKVEAVIIAKENGIVAGVEEVKWFLKKHKIQNTRYKNDGDMIIKGETILKLNGGIKNILKTERTILNLLQRMSGIATETNKLAKLCPNILITPTRKTQWGLLDKKAVTVGGGGTHRLGLYDWILIKDNHLNQTKKYKLKAIGSFWEVEVKNEKQFKHFLQFKPGAIMFDNFKPKNIIKILRKYYKNINDTIIEASGGINKKNIAEYSKTDVDVISLGYLTHSAKALDLSLEIL